MLGSAINAFSAARATVSGAISGVRSLPGRWVTARLDHYLAPSMDFNGWSTIPPDATRNFFYTERVRGALRQRPAAYNAFKWTFDKAFATSALVLTSPVMLAAGAAIRLTSEGPVLFVQKRIGKGDIPFDVYKFRTMHIGSEKLGTYTTTDDDPRVTRVGWLLRRYRIDELPQLVNVLIGDMSVIGPRPDALDAVFVKAELADGFNSRHLTKPGITGLAQVRRIYVNEDLDKLEIQLKDDIRGITQASIMFDIEIMVRTALTMLSGRGK